MKDTVPLLDYDDFETVQKAQRYMHSLLLDYNGGSIIPMALWRLESFLTGNDNANSTTIKDEIFSLFKKYYAECIKDKHWDKEQHKWVPNENT